LTISSTPADFPVPKLLVEGGRLFAGMKTSGLLPSCSDFRDNCRPARGGISGKQQACFLASKQSIPEVSGFRVQKGDQLAEAVIESRGICDQCKRFMTNQQELTILNGKTIHFACTPGVAKMEKRPNSY
jgi:hypothetical protein